VLADDTSPHPTPRSKLILSGVPQVPGPVPIDSATLVLAVIMVFVVALVLRRWSLMIYGDGRRALKLRLETNKLFLWRRLPPFVPHCIMALMLVQLSLMGYYMAGQWETKHVPMDARMDYGVMEAAYPTAYFNQLNGTAKGADAGLGALVAFHKALISRAAHWETYWVLQLSAVTAGTVLFLAVMYINKSLRFVHLTRVSTRTWRCGSASSKRREILSKSWEKVTSPREL
jgi:hypothetical protein